jgi:RNA polymerase sigma-70 factor (ECF subfamily)
MGMATQLEISPGQVGARMRQPRTEADLDELLWCARHGEREVIGQLLTHYRNYLMVLARTQIERRLQPRVSPSDVVQETMLRAHQNFAQFRGQSERELLAWLREILVTSLARFVEQHVLASKRDVRREIPIDRSAATLPLAPHVSSLLIATGDSPSTVLGRRQESQKLAKLLQNLPEHYRQVLVLRNIEGLGFEEVARRLGRSPGATRMLWLRAIDKLRVAYRRLGKDDP